MTSNLKLAKFIDHTLLKPEALASDIEKLCLEAQEFGFAAVCVNPTWTALCARRLKGTLVQVCSVVGFPLGAQYTETKVQEAQRIVEDGGTEIDMVINIGRLRDAEWNYIETEIRQVVVAVAPAIVKVIIETCLLTEAEKVAACKLAQAAGAHFVKTSTGFSHKGATVADVQLMRATVGPELGVKAAGGIRDYQTAVAMIEAGANRIGASASVQIVSQSLPLNSNQ